MAGAGQNNALCAECHFRSHSTSDAVPGQKLDGAALVSFSPNVEASVRVGGVPTFVGTDRGGSCTLKCHGKEHQGTVYVRPVG